MDAGAFIIHHLAEVANPTDKNVQSIGGTVTAIAQALGHGDKFISLEPYFLRGHLDISTIHHKFVINN